MTSLWLNIQITSTSLILVVGECEFTSSAPEIISHSDLKLKIKTNSGKTAKQRQNK